MAGDFTGHAVQGAVDEAVGEAPARGLLHQPLHTRAADMGRTRVLKSGNYDLTPIFPHFHKLPSIPLETLDTIFIRSKLNGTANPGHSTSIKITG